MKKIIVIAALAILSLMTGCTVLTSPFGAGENKDSYDQGSFGGHSHH